ncbi:MAG: regulatory protein RecX [Bacteroidota bacterium]
MAEKKKYLTYEQALQKLQRYCAYQDRCHSEVRSKLIDLGVYGDRLEEIMAELITDNFLNEERFARSYVRGKFRMKQWGRNRIKQELKLRKISAYCIKKGLSEIEEEEYLQTLNKLLTKKDKLLKEPNQFKRNSKLANYVIGKGYESKLVWATIKKRDGNAEH